MYRWVLTTVHLIAHSHTTDTTQSDSFALSTSHQVDKRAELLASKAGLSPAQILFCSTRNDLSAASPLLSSLLNVATALAVIADANMVHGDLKSDNVVMMPDGSAAVVDCGGCEYLPSGKLSLQRRGGTWNYQAPELMDCTIDGAESEGSAASDVFALTVMICELLSKSVTPIFAALMPGLAWLLQCGMASDPADRPTAHDFVEVLEAGKAALSQHLASRPESIVALSDILASPEAQASKLWLADLERFVLDVRFELSYDVAKVGFMGRFERETKMRAAWLACDAVNLKAPQLVCFLRSVALPAVDHWPGGVEAHLAGMEEGLLEVEEVMVGLRVQLELEEGFRNLQQAEADDPLRFKQLYACELEAVRVSHQLLPLSSSTVAGGL